MRIAHISDLHICSSHKRSNLCGVKHLLRYISENNFDHVVITGDITDNATQKDFEISRHLFEKYGLLDNNKLTVVIGNHDIFGGVQKPEDILLFPSRCKQTDYKEKVKKFRDNFIETFWDVYHPNEGNIYPFTKDLGEVLLIGLNSTDYYSKLKNPFASNGRISKKQYEGLEKIFSIEEYKSKFKIVLIHHHFYKEPLCNSNPNLSLLERIEKQTMKLRGKKKLMKIFHKNNIRLVLHGHLHESCEYFKHRIHFLNAGASIENKNRNSFFLNDIEIINGTAKIDIRSINETKFPMSKELYLLDSSSIAVGANNIL